MTKQYEQRDIESLDGYMTHVMAMTAEQLHSKSDIAAELAWRDSQIAALQQKLDAMAAENAALKSAFHPENLPEEAVDAVNSIAQFDWDSNDCGYWTWVVNDDDVAKAVVCAMSPPQTPATDAYMNSVRAEGVEMFSKHCFDKKAIRFWDSAGEEARMFAASLRSGTHDTADKAG